jgi:hypothetical protein
VWLRDLPQNAKKSGKIRAWKGKVQKKSRNLTKLQKKNFGLRDEYEVV